MHVDATCVSRAISVSTTRITAFKGIFVILTVICGAWLIACGSMVFSQQALATGSGDERTQTVTSGLVYFATFLLILVISLAVILPVLWACAASGAQSHTSMAYTPKC